MRYDPNNPTWEGRDRLVVSKGHAAMAVYAVLAEAGFFPTEELERYPEFPYEGHVNAAVAGVEWSTGSLGHGLAVGVGIAIAKPEVDVYVLCGDGETEEGSHFEAAHAARELGVGNLTVIIDGNGYRGYGPTRQYAPARHTHDYLWTVKGCGVSFMQDKNEWHYRAPDDDELQMALEEIWDRDEIS
jgi:transketolase